MSVKFKDNFGEMRRKLNEAIHAGILDVAAAVNDAARGRAPVRTGYLRDSIYMSAVAKHKARVQAMAHYAVFVEFGTSRAAAQPFFIPAVEEVRPRAQEIVAARIREALS